MGGGSAPPPSLALRVAYETTSKDVSKWLALVRHNRQLPTLNLFEDLPQLPDRRSTATLTAVTEPKTEMEREIAAALKEAGAESEARVAKEEALALNKARAAD